MYMAFTRIIAPLLVLTTKNTQTQHHIHPKHKKEAAKIAPANRTIYILVWYAFYDCWPGNGVGPYSYSPRAHKGPNKHSTVSINPSINQSKCTYNVSMTSNKFSCNTKLDSGVAKENTFCAH